MCRQKIWASTLSSFTTYPIETVRDEVRKSPIKPPTITPKYDSNSMSTVLEWHGKKDVRIAQRPKPIITDDSDAIIHVTSSTICGSDLHMYNGDMKGMLSKDIIGHECMGIVESIGPNVKNIKVGDRVVVSAPIACGQCEYCKTGLFSLCDITNDSKVMETMYGHRICGAFGYSHLTGGYDGCQAEWVRVPFADVNLLKIENNRLTDEQVLFLSDIVCTAWHANVLGGVGPGTTVAIWGAGPVGLLTVMWAKYRGAKRIFSIDCIEERLAKARTQGAETIDFSKDNVIETMQKLLPGGPDVCIDAVGFRYTKGMVHKMQRAVFLETDSPEVLDEAIVVVRKGGSVAIIGDYFYKSNQFPIGTFMEKAVTMRGGQLYCQSYWHDLLKIIENGEVDPTFIVTHTMELSRAAEAYKMFDEKSDGTIKVVLKTAFAAVQQSTN
ncbi:unnamed protein product [Adineta steineri]|uniref:Uncharacterized protein n=1 Tax=Adineta steineri TaxID=433720 RepID=A0A815N0J1_9BILA|nr:unnamed protein product [Adineta steineri]CAF1431717.1 unnamed protein product [Adineta steineri]CAF1624616.1 unnamed protein product [Adineta steineri]CAF1624651.1 unnamed protein product [Adineta steineri]